MSFHEIRFPTTLSFGSMGGPERRTEIVELSNGFEERNTPWSESRRRYDAGLGLRSLDDVSDLISFFEAREGQLHGFRWKDWSDYKSCKPSETVDPQDQFLGLGDDETVLFQLRKAYGTRHRTITKPVQGTVRVAVDGDELQETLQWDLTVETGMITLSRPPRRGARVTAGFEYDVPVRFDTDRIIASVASFEAGEVPSVPVVEVRL